MWSRKGSGSRRRLGSFGERRIVFEPLEDRRLLSVGMLQPAAVGETAMLASALPSGGEKSLVSAVAATGPTISLVTVSQAKGRISWNVASSATVTSSTLQIDSVTQPVSGPFPDASGGVNFSGPFGLLQNGVHTYVITATDSNGNTPRTSATFTVSSPIISQVVVSTAKGKLTWNVASPNGVASSTLQVDSISPAVSGPFAADSGVNFSASYGSLGTGTHNYVITAIDKAGNQSTFKSSFSITSTSAGPVISQVGISQASARISWNVGGQNAVATSNLLIDGSAVAASGPFTSSSGGVNFSASIASLSAGTHTYKITAADVAGNSSTITADFQVDSSSGGPTISQIGISQTSGRVSWNVLSTSGVKSTTLTIDTTAVSNISGPFTASSGVNFSASLGTLTSGTHTLTITATDNANVTSTVSQDFVIGSSVGVGPTISGVTIAQPPARMIWNAASANGVASSTLTVDGNPLVVDGPTTAPSGVFFQASLTSLATGPHGFTITATDNLGNISNFSSTFTLGSQTVPGPTVGSVAISEARARISWNAVDASGVTATTISIDGSPVTGVLGPFAAASGVNFSAPLDSLNAGTHTYSITAFNGLGGATTIADSFTLAATTTYNPMIRMATIAQSRGRISWNVLSPNTIVNTTLQIDGANVTGVIGPFASSSGVNFSGPLGSLVAGSHSYRITATDNVGRQSTVLANFNISPSTAALQSAVFSNIGSSALTNSAKVDWTLDLTGLADSTALAS